RTISCERLLERQARALLLAIVLLAIVLLAIEERLVLTLEIFQFRLLDKCSRSQHQDPERQQDQACRTESCHSENERSPVQPQKEPRRKIVSSEIVRRTPSDQQREYRPAKRRAGARLPGIYFVSLIPNVGSKLINPRAAASGY